MNLVRLALLVLASGCVLTADGAERSASHSSSDLLPAPTGPLRVDFGEDTTLGEILSAFAANTGQHVLLDGRTEAVLAQRPVVLGGATEVPAAEVYAFVEGLLYFHDLFVAPIKGGERPLLGVYSEGHGLRKATPMDVAEQELERYADHPALLIRTTVQLTKTDVRQLATSLRAMLMDTNTQLLLPVGDNSILMGGTGSDVARLARTMRAIDEDAGRAQAARQAKRAEGEPDPSKEGAR